MNGDVALPDGRASDTPATTEALRPTELALRKTNEETIEARRPIDPVASARGSDSQQVNCRHDRRVLPEKEAQEMDRSRA